MVNSTGAQGHGRVDCSHLPVREEEWHFREAKRCCPKCGKATTEFPGTEESAIIEIEIRAYRRVIRRKRYRPSYQCEDWPGILTAPGPARLIPKGRLGVSVWVEILLSKYLYAQPTNRVLQSWANVGFTPSQGTIIGGLKHLAPLFTPVVEALQAQQLTEDVSDREEAHQFGPDARNVSRCAGRLSRVRAHSGHGAGPRAADRSADGCRHEGRGHFLIGTSVAGQAVGACPCQGMGWWLEAGSYLERREIQGWWSSPGWGCSAWKSARRASW